MLDDALAHDTPKASAAPKAHIRSDQNHALAVMTDASRHNS